MWCAYAFAALALTSLPQNLDTAQHFILWASSTFLQLVLLSVLMVGQGIAGRSTDAAIQSILADVSGMIQPIKDSHDQMATLVAEIHEHHFGKAMSDE